MCYYDHRPEETNRGWSQRVWTSYEVAAVLNGRCMATVRTLEWLAAKQYSAMLSLNVIPEHVQHLSNLPLAIRENFRSTFKTQYLFRRSPPPTGA